MRLVEIRHFEGPNLFLNQPAIKLEFQVEDRDSEPAAWQAREALLAAVGVEPVALHQQGQIENQVMQATEALARSLHARLALPEPQVASRRQEAPGRVATAFSWERRSIGLAIARLVADLLVEPEQFVTAANQQVASTLQRRITELRDLVARPLDPQDAPDLILRQAGRPRIVAVTGTNGKTTTTRLIAYILRQAGYTVGWTSTTGIYLNGQEIEAGDWSGPDGARRLLNRSDLDWAVLETARGGILRRGLAFQEADVTVFINVSADHLGDYGVLSVEGIAAVKAVVPRVTAPDGLAVLNADDPLVMRSVPSIRAPICLVSQEIGNPLVKAHEQAGGMTVVAKDGAIVYQQNHQCVTLAELRTIPITFEGRARHMIENVLCAVGAALGCGIQPSLIAESITTFGNDPNDNPGRLTLYDVHGVRVLGDYAHNEAGLTYLLDVADSLRHDRSDLWTIIGTAGDRSDEVLRRLARLAAQRSDHVIAKDSPHYLRGRRPGEMQSVMLKGIAEVDPRKGSSANDEVDAIDQALSRAKAGDVVAVMASDTPDEVRWYLEQRGQRVQL